MTRGCVIDRPGGCVVAVRVVPRARRTGIGGERGGSLLLRVAAPPVEDAANDAVLDLLADALGVSRRVVRILRGARGREKLVEIDGLTAAAATSRIEARVQTDTRGRGR